MGRVKGQTLQSDILDVIKSSGGAWVSLVEIERRVQCSRKSLLSALLSMEKSGKIMKFGSNRSGDIASYRLSREEFINNAENQDEPTVTEKAITVSIESAEPYAQFEVVGELIQNGQFKGTIVQPRTPGWPMRPHLITEL
jgi:hypothetical protein